MMKIENSIEANFRKLSDNLNNEYEDLYDYIDNDKLKIMFSTLHAKLVNLFDLMNSRLPTAEDETAHFWADPSRDLIFTIGIIEALHRSLKNSQFAFTIDEDYSKIISQCKAFLKRSSGSTIPPKTEKIELYYTIPIFLSQNSIEIKNNNFESVSNLHLIGEGSYAKVFKYYDEFYKKDFVLKRAKKDLNSKEISRFEREYEQMNSFKSPYIVEVFRYNEKNKEYIMEYMDVTLNKYILTNNAKLTFQERKKIINQIIRAFSYIHSKGLLHRDISPNNILLKKYDDVIVVKISDFGLVRLQDSELTSLNTEFKGSFNDPNLMVEGFDTYNILHETYALTRLLYFVITGKTRTDNIKPNLKNFVSKGLDSNKEHRFKDIDELNQAFKKIKYN